MPPTELTLAWPLTRTFNFPCADKYASLVKNRPEAICVHAGVCSTFETVHYAEGKDPVANGIYEFMAPSFAQRWHPNINLKSLPTISCVPLMFILDRCGRQVSWLAEAALTPWYAQLLHIWLWGIPAGSA